MKKILKMTFTMMATASLASCSCSDSKCPDPNEGPDPTPDVAVTSLLGKTVDLKTEDEVYGFFSKWENLTHDITTTKFDETLYSGPLPLTTRTMTELDYFELGKEFNEEIQLFTDYTKFGKDASLNGWENIFRAGQISFGGAAPRDEERGAIIAVDNLKSAIDPKIEFRLDTVLANTLYRAVDPATGKKVIEDTIHFENYSGSQLTIDPLTFVISGELNEDIVNEEPIGLFLESASFQPAAADKNKLYLIPRYSGSPTNIVDVHVDLNFFDGTEYHRVSRFDFDFVKGIDKGPQILWNNIQQTRTYLPNYDFLVKDSMDFTAGTEASDAGYSVGYAIRDPKGANDDWVFHRESSNILNTKSSITTILEIYAQDIFDAAIHEGLLTTTIRERDNYESKTRDFIGSKVHSTNKSAYAQYLCESYVGDLGDSTVEISLKGCIDNVSITA